MISSRSVLFPYLVFFFLVIIIIIILPFFFSLLFVHYIDLIHNPIGYYPGFPKAHTPTSCHTPSLLTLKSELAQARLGPYKFTRIPSLTGP
jgi:hypothetical protein